jgi:hypothetical protein
VRVDFTRLRVIENKTMRVKSTRMCVVKKKLSTGLVPVEVYVYYYEFKGIFLMLLGGLRNSGS